MRDTRLLQTDFTDLADDLVRAVDRGGRRQLRDRNDVLLVLIRDEATRDRVESEVRQGDQATVDHERDAGPTDNRRRRPGVRIARTLKPTIEALEEGTQDACP